MSGSPASAAASTPASARVTVDNPSIRSVVVTSSSNLEKVTYIVVAKTGVSVTTQAPRIVLVGQQGTPGRPGRDGVGAPIIFEQDSPSATWTIAHGLGRYPIVQVYDLSGNSRPLVPVSNPDTNTTVLTPNPPLAGKAVLL